jgi:tRNA(Ile)-lysidine synthase
LRKGVSLNSTSIAELVKQDFLRLCDAGAGVDVPGAPKVKVLVALSGGIDSVSLLSILQDKLPQQFEVLACYVNHKLRLDTAQDEAFCGALCAKLGIPFFLEAIDLPGAGRPPGEALLRERRYDCLKRVALENKALYVVTAHNFDDQVETVMLRLFRGTSLAGLQAIEEKRELAPQLWLLRPLLKIPRRQIESYLQEKGLGFQEDSTNKEVFYKRNYFRLKVAPLLQEGFPGWQQAVSRFAQAGFEDEQYLSGLAGEALSAAILPTVASGGMALKRQVFLGLPPSLKRRLLADLWEKEGIAVNFSRLELALEHIAGGAGKLSLAAGKYLLVSEGEIKIVEQGGAGKSLEEHFYQEKFAPIKFALPSGGSSRRVLVSWLNHVLVLRRVDEQLGVSLPEFPSQMSSKCLVDLSRITSDLEIRLRQPHDLVQPLGMKNKVKLKRYLQTHQPEAGQVLLSSLLPVDNMFVGSALERRLMVVLADQEEVLWVPGIGLSEKVKVSGREAWELEFLPLVPGNFPQSNIQQTC